MQHDYYDSGFESEGFFTQNQLPAIPSRAETPLFGNARRAQAADLTRYLTEPEDEPAGVLRDASLLVEHPNGGELEGLFKRDFYLPAEIRRRNVAIIGQIGSGKTQELIMPLAISDIADPTCSAIIVDFKGDVESKIAPFMKQFRPRQRACVINFTNRRRTTHGWNPFAVNNDSESALDDAMSFSAASHDAEQDQDSPFWDGSAARWIAALMFRLRDRYDQVCPADVYRSLELDRTTLLRLLKEGSSVPFAAGVASFLESGSHNAETVLATAQMYYRIFQDPDMASVTSADEFRFETIFKRPTIVVLEVAQKDVARLRPLLNLFFLQLFREAARFAATQRSCRLPVPLNLHLDDFAAAMGRIPEMGQHLNLARSSDVRVTAAVQSLAQIEHFYRSEAESVISGFSTYILKSPVSLKDAEWASKHSGMSTVEEVNVVEELDEESGEWKPTTRTVKPVARRVLLPEEIRQGPEHFLFGRAATVILPDVPVFQAWFRPAYDTPGIAEAMAEAMSKPRRKSLRRKPLEWQGPPIDLPSAGGFTDTRGLPDAKITELIERTKEKLEWDKTTGSARKWWTAFEEENQHRLGLVLRLAEELAHRKATIVEFFLAYVYGNSDNIQASLHYLDYSRLKKEEEKRKRNLPKSEN